MSNSRRRNFREDETLEAAARRLLQEWDERIARKKAAERLEASAQIADQSCPSADKRADGESDQGVSTLNRRPQLTATREDGEVGSGWVAGGV
jgi:hypothetical protein